MPRDLVTGGCGFIGNHLVKRLLASGRQVAVLDDMSGGDRKVEGAEYHVGDVCNMMHVQRAMSGVDRVFHLAGLVWVTASFSMATQYRKVNTTGSQLVASLAGKRPMLMASSCVVYPPSVVNGQNEPVPLSETTTTIAMHPYAESKLWAEKAWPGVACRFFNVYGPGQERSGYAGVIDKFVKQIKAGEPVTICGTGSQTRDYVYVDDAVEAMIRLIDKPKGPYNVGTGIPTSVKSLAEKIAKVMGVELNVQPEYARPGDAQDSWADTSKLEATCGWKPSVTLEQGLEWTIRGRS